MSIHIESLRLDLSLFESIKFTENELQEIAELLDYYNLNGAKNIKSQSNFKDLIVNNISPRYLYLIRCINTDFYKIGITNKIDIRLQNLQTGCPLELKIVFVAVADMGDFLGREITYLEAFLKNNYKSQLERGEWFNLSYENISDLCFFLEDSRGLELLYEQSEELRIYIQKNNQILLDESE